MKLFGYNFTVERATGPGEEGDPGKTLLSPEVAQWLTGGSGGTATLVSGYEQSVWVYRAVNAIAEQVANIPFRFSTISSGGRDRLAGRLQEFYNRPHPLMNGFQYWELRVMWLLLRGECFRVPIYEAGPGGRRVLSRILMLDPANFQHIVERSELVGWRYTGSYNGPAGSQIFLPEEVWFERLPNPFDFWRGLSPLSVAASAASGDYAASRFMKGLLENNGDVGVVVKTSEMLDAEQRDQIMAALRERKRAAGTADRPLLLWGGAEIEAPTMSSADMQLLEHRRFSIAEICAAFGVPEEVLTTMAAAKYDIMQGSRLNFVENRIGPLCRRLEAEEQATVRAIEPKAMGWFDVEDHPVMAAARRERLKVAQAGFAMGIPLNELNNSLQLGFREFPWGNVGYVPGNMRRAEVKAHE
jgi:HK97 family phage portal protein